MLVISVSGALLWHFFRAFHTREKADEAMSEARLTTLVARLVTTIIVVLRLSCGKPSLVATFKEKLLLLRA